MITCQFGDQSTIQPLCNPFTHLQTHPLNSIQTYGAFTHSSIYQLSIYLSIHQPTNPSNPPIHQSTYPSIYLSFVQPYPKSTHPPIPNLSTTHPRTQQRPGVFGVLTDYSGHGSVVVVVDVQVVRGDQVFAARGWGGGNGDSYLYWKLIFFVKNSKKTGVLTAFNIIIRLL